MLVRTEVIVKVEGGFRIQLEAEPIGLCQLIGFIW